MNELKVFEHEEFGKVRVVFIGEDPWWVLRDVCDVLGIGNTTDTANRLDEDEKATFDSIEGMRKDMIYVSEVGLYNVVLRSEKMEAKQFKRWITHEVLPSIRRTGGYSVTAKLPQTYIEALKALVASEEEKERLKTENQCLVESSNVKDQQLAELQPKATYYDIILSCDDAIPIRTIAKDYGKSAQWMSNFLHESGIQYKQRNTWLLYHKHANKGYTKTETHHFTTNDGAPGSEIHTCWTQKGRLFIYELMKNSGHLPVIELDLEVDPQLMILTVVEQTS